MGLSGHPPVPNQYLLVFASGKDRKPTTPGGKLHTNFKLKINGEYLGLFSPESPRQVINEIAPEFPEQRNDYSFGRAAGGAWRYFRVGTPPAQSTAPASSPMWWPGAFQREARLFQSPFQSLSYD